MPSRLLILSLAVAALSAVELSADGSKAVVPDPAKPLTAASAVRTVTWTLGRDPATLTIAIELHAGAGGSAKARAQELLAEAVQGGAKISDEKGMGGGFHLLEAQGDAGKPVKRVAVASAQSAWLSVLVTSTGGFNAEWNDRNALDGLLQTITLDGTAVIPPTALRFLLP